MLLTRSPLIHPASWASAFDLHVLSTPPAFVLSQDQTLRTKTKTLKPRKTNQKTRSAIPTKNTQKQKTGIKQKQTNTLSSSQTTPTHSNARRKSVRSRKVFRAKFPRPSFSLRSLPFGATRRTLRTCPPIVKSRLCAPPRHALPQDSAVFGKIQRHIRPFFRDFHAPEHRMSHKVCATTRFKPLVAHP